MTETMKTTSMEIRSKIRTQNKKAGKMYTLKETFAVIAFIFMLGFLGFGGFGVATADSASLKIPFAFFGAAVACLAVAVIFLLIYNRLNNIYNQQLDVLDDYLQELFDFYRENNDGIESLYKKAKKMGLINQNRGEFPDDD